jgi:hypothetical protein
MAKIKLKANVAIQYGAGEDELALPGVDFYIEAEHAKSLIDGGHAEEVEESEADKKAAKAAAKAAAKPAAEADL